ncbi:MAG: alpha-glucan family phosphorylase [Pyrinomonadaceae bacterium]
MSQLTGTVRQKCANSFRSPVLPGKLEFLEQLSQNFYFGWHSDANELFRDLEPTIWEEVEQNPSELLCRISDLRLWQKANDMDFLDRLNSVKTKFENYLNQPVKEDGQFSDEAPVAYFCAEYGVHNSLPIYSGGLGILSGDHLKSSSDLNVPLFAIGLLYRFGYFRQFLQHTGWQEERYVDVFEHNRALLPVNDEEGNRLIIDIPIQKRTVYAQVWLAKIGRVSLYLLDTNIEQNSEVDQLITGHLYGGERETRIVQEIVLGIGGVRLIRKLQKSPAVYHLNEGHSAFLTLELIREEIAKNGELSFDDAAEIVRNQCVFTTHTPVAAGNDEFSPELIDAYFTDEFLSEIKIDRAIFKQLGKTDISNEEQWFGMTPLALRLTRKANGVSRKHGEVSRGLWVEMFDEGTEIDAVPITHITNGVHPPTWTAPHFKAIFDSHIGENWLEVTRQGDDWSRAVERIPNAEVWNAHLALKNLLVAFIRERTRRKDTGSTRTINEHQNTDYLLDPNALTIGFARRVAGYKRWNLIMHDLERLLKMVNDDERPVQFVFAGKAHPQDKSAKTILQNLMQINHESSWQKRAVYIADYDQEIARYLVQGVDVWLNVPRRPLEASGTSGQKVAMNGGLNFSVLDGWWLEGYNEVNGFAIGGEFDSFETEEENDAADAGALYKLLEETIIPEYYALSEQGIPEKWVTRMKNAIGTLTNQFSSDRMVSDYFEKVYRT